MKGIIENKEIDYCVYDLPVTVRMDQDISIYPDVRFPKGTKVVFNVNWDGEEKPIFVIL